MVDAGVAKDERRKRRNAKLCGVDVIGESECRNSLVVRRGYGKQVAVLVNLAANGRGGGH